MSVNEKTGVKSDSDRINMSASSIDANSDDDKLVKAWWWAHCGQRDGCNHECVNMYFACTPMGNDDYDCNVRRAKRKQSMKRR